MKTLKFAYYYCFPSGDRRCVHVRQWHVKGHRSAMELEWLEPNYPGSGKTLCSSVVPITPRTPLQAFGILLNPPA